MTDNEKTASMNESGMRARQGDLYNDKVNDNLINKQVFEAENADGLQPTTNNPQFDFSKPDVPEPSHDDTTNEVMELPTWGLPEPLRNVIDEAIHAESSHVLTAVQPVST